MKELNIKSEKIILSGGGSRSSLWRQIMSDVLNSKVITLNIDESPAFGAAIIAGKGCGIYSDIKDIAYKIINEVEHENIPIAKNAKKYSKIYQIYKSL